MELNPEYNNLSQYPTMLAGDFNQVLQPIDKLGWKTG